MTTNIDEERHHLTWGDVLSAAIGACMASGPDTVVSDEDLPKKVRKIRAVEKLNEAYRGRFNV